MRLRHVVPPWVNEGACFHIRIRCARGNRRELTDPALAPRLLESAQRYAEAGKWWSHLFLLMPDHVHALLVFPELDRLSDTVGQWKRFHAKLNGIRWQSSFFDHRLRHDESFEEKVAYIRRNPVVKGLCAHEDDWPWVLIGEH